MQEQYQSVKEFKNGVTKGAISKNFAEETILAIDKIDIFYNALLQGYDDAKRTFTGVGKHWEKVGNKKKESFFQEIAQKIQELFRMNAKGQINTNNFDEWHSKTCQFFCEKMKNMGYNKVTYGHAQKVINMAMKYLSCLNQSAKYSLIFKRCHMPLDSFTLEWYKRVTAQDDKRDKVKLPYDMTWSKLDERLYLDITKKIQEKLKQELYLTDSMGNQMLLPEEPLMAEFIIWPNIQLQMAVEEFYFAYTGTNDKEDFKKQPLNQKLKIIKEILPQ